MSRESNRAALFARYLKLLGQAPAPPTLESLAKLVRAHIIRCPFENISKLYRVKHLGLRRLPGLEAFLDGMERHHLGGTCYTNNHRFYQLLRHLGFEASFCGADMSAPDVHTVILVRVAGREYLVDVGYTAPLFTPLPRDLSHDQVLRWGKQQYVIKPRDHLGRSRLEVRRQGKVRHGYRVNPEPREIAHFDVIIQDSLADSALFMNAIRLERHHGDRSVSLINRSLTLVDSRSCSTQDLAHGAEIAAAIEQHFEIPHDIVDAALSGLTELRDVNE